MHQSRYLKEHHTELLKTPHFLIHYIHMGAGSPVILIHGGGMWLYSFRHTIAPLSCRSSVYALDMPGYGYTAVTDHTLPMGIETMTLAIDELMDGLAVEKASLVGHSWGGGWALAYALAHPERVERIVLIDSSGLDVPDVLDWELLKIPLAGGFLLRLLTRGMMKRRLELSFVNKKIVDEAMVHEAYLPMRIPENRKAQSLLARNISWEPIERKLDILGKQVLLIWGEHDKYLDVGLVKRFQDRIRDLRVEIIRGCGHSAHEESPDEVNRLIMEFLGGQNP